jgi:predicted Zn-dependent protease
MNLHNDDRDEEQIASLLASTERGAATPDREFLGRLRALSTEAFSKATSQPTPMGERKRPMFPYAARWLGTAAAAAVVLALGLYFWVSPERSAVAFGKVLENSENAKALHLRISFQGAGKGVEFWHANQPKRSRWEDQAGQYRIADGGKYWIVNEKTNQVRQADLPQGAERPITQFLDLLGVPGERGDLFSADPVKRVRDGEQEVLVYRVELASPQGKIWVDASVLTDTRRIRSIKTSCEKDGKTVPLAELTVLGYDEPVGAEKFVVADTLTEDGRIGKVADVQGVVSIKPVLHERWTPVRNRLVLQPGDWVRTDARGANATALQLVKKTGVILGPKTLVELIGPKHIRISEGEIELTVPTGAAVELLGPDRQKIAVKGTQFFRVEKDRLVRVEPEPAWLLGFRGTTTNETLGSLVATVDGRNVPLSVGYHKVTVDIRDQIARTVIEESFVNHTNAQLEGVFFFPLPDGASISGFGMWIGDNLIEADVVEKQRAREIYEIIMSERRDPGLLEWSGGNIFKARVWPIFGQSEKRIKITYTQVLPLQGNRYRYSYALQSELLQQHPLRELSIDVKLNSALPLKSISSPTHPARIDKTARSAHVEFTAQEYTPTRDFEAVIEVDGNQADVVMIPHRRGDDGYFMLQLSPHGAPADPQRPILPDGDPLRLLILADTSASMDPGQRATQETFIASLLSALSPNDTFNLGTCDVTCDWAFTRLTSADAAGIAEARSYLARRNSLGWTNLDLAFAEALKKSDPKTHVIYVGDGIVTSGDADPVAFTKRLRKAYHGRSGTFHAVTLGSSYEAGVMKAIASLGGGSVRKITGERGPQAVALELLGEIAIPGMRDINVEFKGLKVARLYPEELANVPAGAQQILLGRYLPEGRDQTGEVIVTGIQGGKPVRYSTKVSLKDAEQGNSFIPRLWARMHLDSLLDQGASEIIRDEIIALSEEYQIITPYTSFLVLETDADRERFKVKRRFRMRDGEQFFAEGRDTATFDLKQKQMKKAGQWRVALRRSVLRQLAELGRDPRLFQPGWRYREYAKVAKSEALEDCLPDGGMAYFGGMPMSSPGGLAPVGDLGIDVLDETKSVVGKDWDDGTSNTVYWDRAIAGETDSQREEWGAPQAREPLALEEAPSGPAGLTPFGTFTPDLDILNGYFPGFVDREAGGVLDFRTQAFGRGGRAITRGPNYSQWLNALFPQLRPIPAKTKEPKSPWPAQARELAKSLLRAGGLAKMTGGVQIARQSDWFDARWESLTSRSRALELFSADSWLTRSQSDGGQTLVSWCDPKEHGTFSEAFLLGRLRASTSRDLQPPPLDLTDHSLTSLERTYAGYTPTLQSPDKDRTLLVLKHPTSLHDETRILIDTARHVILTIEERHKGKITIKTQFDDFTQAAGCWWARRIERTDETGKRLSLVTQTIKTLSADAFAQHLERELAGRAQVQFLRVPVPSVRNAKKAVAAGKASFADQFVLMLHFSRSQQWARALEHLEQAEKLAASKGGMRWVRSAMLYDSRRHQELQQRFLAEANKLTENREIGAGDEYYLAEYLVGQSGRVLQANEMLGLLEVLQPVYDRQPAHVQARKRWLHNRVSYLAQAGQTDQALSLRKQLATDYPRDYTLQQEYAQALAAGGDYPGAYAWLTRVLVKEARWLSYEEESLRGVYAQLLQQQGRYPDLVNYLAAWVNENPDRRSAYEQYLTALIKTDQIEKADALAARWLQEAQVAGELSAAAEARLQAAFNMMLGQGYQLYTNRIEPRWLAPLAKAVLFFARHETQGSVAQQIMSQYNFQRTDEGRQLRQRFAAILAAEIDKLPHEQIQRFVYWLHWEDLDPAGARKIAERLGQRWSQESNDEAKHILGQAQFSILSSHATSDAVLAFVRLQMQKGPEKYRATYTNQLFERLLIQPWSATIEDEACGLLDKLSPETSEVLEPSEVLFAAVGALHRLTDKIVEARYTARMKALAHPEKLTRTELLKKQEEFRRLAREGFADKLAKEAAKHPKALAKWLTAERLYLDVLLDRNLKEAAAHCWEYLGAQPPALKQLPGESGIGRVVSEVLRQRYLVTVMNLAARKGAEPGLVERVVKYLDKGIAADPDDGRWQLAKFRLLIARDKFKELEQTLGHWIREDEGDNRWRIALGHLLAEQGRVAEAIKQFEAVEKADELDPAAYRALASWYMIENNRTKHERAASAVYKTTDEYRLARTLAAMLNPWQRRDGHLPTELDPEVLRVFKVLFEKSSSPQYYLYHLQQFYQASHDFRLLSVLADAVVGHTAGKVYPFLQGMDSILSEIRDEATADELVKRIGEVKQRAQTAVDRRALDLLEGLVERRAAELQNQPGPHVARALGALQRAFKEEWSQGEPRLMADFLAGLHRISQQTLAREQLRELQFLHDRAAAGSLDRLHIGHRRAVAFNDYSRTAEAIDLLQAALKEFQDANKGVLPVSANDALTSYVNFLNSAGHFGRGEKVLFAQLEHPAHQQQRLWLTQQLYGLYHLALQNGGGVSLGTGHELYQALAAKIQGDLANAEDSHRQQLIDLLCRVYRTAADKKLPGVVDDLKTFAFKVVPPVLKRQTNNHDSLVATVAHTVRDLAGPEHGIVFLLNQIEGEPRWLRFNNQDGWSRHGSTLATWRTEAKQLGEAEGRLLKLVLGELRRDLETRESRNRTIYARNSGRYWEEKEADFTGVAEEVLARHNQSGQSVQYIGEYFYWGLGHANRAIEVLFAGHKQKLLDEAGQTQLVDYLHRENRHDESIPLLRPLVQRRPENLQYRVLLLHAYFRSGMNAELLALLKQTDALFHQKDRWTEAVMASLAQSCLQNQLYDQSVAYFKEAIPLHERTAPRRGIGNGVLSGYYSSLALAYAGLGKTAEAVDAAGGAIVAWGPTHTNRAQALETLKQVLARSPNLDAFVSHWSKQKQDSAIVRKALGQVYRSRGELAKAIRQLQLATELQANDADLYPLLVSYHDQMGDREGALNDLLKAVQLSRREIKLYQELGNRYAAIGQAKEAERAYTSIVEVLPTEAESHAMLAEVRQQQDRWNEAITHWQHVARLRALEPTGLLKLAAAQIHQRQWEQAWDTLRQLNSRTWPARFSDVHQQVRALEDRLAKAEKTRD